jgi:diguanylate cyclase (GGDEF)-like protein
MITRKSVTTRSLVNVDELRELELLRFVSPESIEGIIDSCSVQDLKKNDVLLDLGQSNRHLFLILSGRMRVHMEDVGQAPVAVLGRGEAIGELSLIDHRGACAIVVADTDARLLVIEEDLLWSLVQVSHAAACNLLKILTRRLRGSASGITDRLQLEHAIHQYGNVDALSGLHNRHWLDRTLSRLVSRAQQSGEPLSLLLFDIDRFKQCNDRYGYVSGDLVIHTLGRILSDNLRAGELAARYGCDKFMVMLPGVDCANALIIAERIRQQVLETIVILRDGTRLPPLSISIGMVQARLGATPEELLAVAEAALCRAKKKGRNTLSE